MTAITYYIERTRYIDRDERGPRYLSTCCVHKCATLDEARRAASEYAETYADILIADATRNGADGATVDVRPVDERGIRYALVSSYVVDGVHGVVAYHDDEIDHGHGDPLPDDAREAAEDEEARDVAIGRTVTWTMDGYHTVDAPIAYVWLRSEYGRLRRIAATPALTHAQMSDLRATLDPLADRYGSDEFCRLRYDPLHGVWSELYHNGKQGDGLVGDEYEIWPTVIGGTRYYLVGFESGWPWTYED